MIHKLTPQQVLDKLKNHTLKVDSFLKKPERQNIGENILYNYLINSGIVNESNLEILPKASKKSAYLCGDKILYGKKKSLTNKISYLTKSIDFKIIINIIDVFFSHKILNNSGGAQNSQFDEMKNFVNEANKIKMKNTYVGVFVNGKYFTPNRIDELKSLVQSKYVFVCDETNIIKFLLNL